MCCPLLYSEGQFFSYKIVFFFGSTCVCSKIVGFDSFRKLCSVVAVLKFKCMAILPVMNFYRGL